MTKKVFLLSIITCLISAGLAFGGTADNCGCGIGTMIFKENDSLLMQLFAATTNGSFGNQTFGITSGTLGCEKPASIVKRERLNKFVAKNMDNLAKDIATGQGEFIETLAELMEVPAEKRNETFTLLQSNFSNIFTSQEIDHITVIENIIKVTHQG